MNKILLPISFAFALLLAVACNREPDFYVEEGSLDFSVDTIYFDSIFTNFDSPTERVTVINNSGNNVLISRIEFEDGRDFGMIFDGLTTNLVEDYELPDGDSAVAFVNFTSDIRDEFLRDKLLFTVGDQTQDVDIEAFIFDGILLRDTILSPELGNSVTLDPNEKYIVDGFLAVPEGVTLIIPAGTQLYFTPRKDAEFNLSSSILVFGTLRVDGELGNEVVFQQTRFGDRYEETADQWRGIAFFSSSSANIIRHAIVKNALIGIYQEFGNSAPFPKVYLDRCEIRNMSAYGILSVGFLPQLPTFPMIKAENCVIHNCATSTFRTFGGGYYEFDNCTFANYSINFTRNTPQLWVDNYDATNLVPLPVDARFRNCIVWGSEEEEYVQDTFPGTSFDIRFEHCFVRTTLPIQGFSNTTNNDPFFPSFVEPRTSSPADRDYRLTPESPAVDAGQDIGLRIDKDNLMRDALPDLGAYESQE